MTSQTSAYATYDTSYAARTPYLTTAEYQNAPQALDLNNLISGNNAANLTALQETIARASSWVDQYTCGMWGTLCATQNAENNRIWMSRDYTFRVRTKYQPILSVDAFAFTQVGTSFSLAASVTPAGNVWIEPQEFVVNPFASSSFSGNGLNLSGWYGGGCGGATGEYYCSWLYTNGWPNTTLAVNASVGATQIIPTNVTGIYPGTMLTLYDLPNDEAIQVSPSYQVGASVVPFAIPLSYSHTTAATITNLPPAIKQAAIWATSAMIKQRGSGALIMEDMGATKEVESGNPQNSNSDWWRAEELLIPFRQMFVSY